MGGDAVYPASRATGQLGSRRVADTGPRNPVPWWPSLSETVGVVRLLGMNSEAAAAELERRAGSARTGEILEALYLAHHEAVFRYLRAISRDEDRALDLAASTFERAFAEVRAGRDPGIGWLLRTARNAAIDADRRSRTAALFRWRSSGAEGSAPSPEEQTLGAEQATRVRAALALLPRPQRDVIALRYTSDLTIREIAVVIGKRASATQKLLDRGLARLKESLDDRD